MPKEMSGEQRWTNLSPNEAYFQAALQLAQFELLEEEIPSLEESEGNAELDQKILRLIDAQFKKLHRRQALKQNITKTIKTFVMVLLVLNLFVTVAYAINSEFRDSVYKLFVETLPTRTEVKLVNETTGAEISRPTDFIPKYRAFWFPDDSYRIVDAHDTLNDGYVTYKSDSGAQIYLNMCDEDGTISINTEGMEKTTRMVDGKEIQVFSKENEVYLVWYDLDENFFVLDAAGISLDDALRVALSVGESNE